MAEGASQDCLAAQALVKEGFGSGSEPMNQKEKVTFSELDVAYTVASPFGAGIETVGITLAKSHRSPPDTIITDRWDSSYIYA